MRLPVVEVALTALVFLECPDLRTGEVLILSLVYLTAPSAVLFLDCAPSASFS